MLTLIPKEVLGKIINNLARHDTYQLLFSCNYLYLTGLPYLYAHLELGYYIHIRQLKNGILKNQYLKDIISSDTRQLTLKSRQNGNNWRIQDLSNVLGPKSQVNLLIFSNFYALSTETIKKITSLLPNLKVIEFRYCHIVYQPLNKHKYHCNYTIPDMSNLPKLDRISYTWTDFTENSIFPSLFPQITKLELGSNRNIYNSINGLMVSSIAQHCPNITHLTIALPQIDESVLCDTITHYGMQLQQLSIKCDGYRTLLAISTQASRIHSLTVRVTSVTDEDISPYVAQIVTTCKYLQDFEIVSTQLYQDIPNIIWESIIACAKGDSIITQNKRSRAQDALMVRQKKQRESNDLKTEMASRQRILSRRNSLWFHVISEEALEQRYRYNNSLNGRYQHQRNNFEYIRLDHQELKKSVNLSQNHILKELG
jgi:hypothetical protein